MTSRPPVPGVDVSRGVVGRPRGATAIGKAGGSPPGHRLPGLAPPPLSADLIHAAAWPLQDFLELGALPGAVPCARLHTRQLLWEWQQDHAIETGELVVSELVTNSVDASRPLRGPRPVRLWLLSDGRRVVIQVADASPSPPKPAEPNLAELNFDSDGGRGLLLVEAVSERWGWYPWPAPPISKVVWAQIGDAAGKG